MKTKMRKKQWGKVFFVFFLFFVCALAHPEFDFNSDDMDWGEYFDYHQEEDDGWSGDPSTNEQDIHDFAIDVLLNSSNDDDDDSSSASTGGSGGSGGGSSSSSSASESSAGGATESNSESENSSSSSANNESVEDAEEEEEEEDEDFWSGEVEVNFGPEGLDGHAFSNGDEVFATVLGSDGEVIFVSREDVYDDKGNFIYVYTGPGNKEEVEARLADIFSNREKYSDMDAETLLSLYLNALQELDSAKKAGAEAKSLTELESKAADIRSYLDAYCEKEGYVLTIAENKLSGAITNREGKTVCYVGDPVMFSSGVFVIDDSDLCVSVQRANFEIKRHYSLANASSESERFGIFGRGWSSNLESRIVFGYAKDFIDALPAWEQYIERLSESEKRIHEYADEDSSCSPIYEKICMMQEKALAEYETIQEYVKKSEQIREENKPARYGFCAEYAETVGLGTAIYALDEGGFVVFRRNEDGSFSLLPAFAHCRIELACIEDGYCVSFPITGEKRYYAENGLPRLYVGSAGERVAFSYDEENRIDSLSLNGKKKLSFIWEGNHLASVRDEISGREVRYEYENDMLSSVTDWENDKKAFAYNENLLLSKQIKADGSFVSFEYEEIDGVYRTVRTSNEEGKSERFSYDTENRLTVYTDYDGVSTSFWYDERGRTIREEKADGFFTEYAYDSENHLLSKTDPFGTISYAYDSEGNIIQKTYPDGSTEQWKYSQNRLSSFTDRDGICQSYSYNSDSLMSDIFRSSHLFFHFDYDSSNMLLAVTDCSGNRTQYLYDELGNIIEEKLFAPQTGMASKTEKWEYDEQGRASVYTNALGEKTNYTYSAHCVTSRNDRGLEVTERYSERKLLLSKTVRDMKTGEERTISFDYDKNKRCCAEYISGITSLGKTVAKTKVVSFSYTDVGQLSRCIEYGVFSLSEESILTEYDYGSGGELVAVRMGRYDEDSDSFSGEVKSLAYSSYFNSEGWVQSKIGWDGIRTATQCDASARVLFTETNSVKKAISEYSPAGRLLRSKNGRANFSSYSYASDFGYCTGRAGENGAEFAFSDRVSLPDGRIVSERDSNGVLTEFSYDANGNIVKVHFPSGTIERSYDALGRLLFEVTKNTNGDTVKEDSWEYEGGSVYHLSGQKYAETVFMNAFGETVAVLDGNGNKKTYLYDIQGRLVSERNAAGTETHYSYNARNQLVGTFFADGTCITYRYDECSNCTEAADSLGTLWKKSYDSLGRVVAYSERPFFVTESYEYNEYDEVVTVRAHSLVRQTAAFSPDGKMTECFDSLGTRTEYRSDDFGRLLSWKNAQGNTSQAEYNADGSLKSLTDFRGQTKTYRYGADRLSFSVHFADGDFVSYEYDCAGNLVRAQNACSDISFSYDTGGKLVGQYEYNGKNAIHFDYDACGNIVRMRSEGRDCSYSWGKNGELLSLSDRIIRGEEICATGINFVYDERGREILRVYDSGESLRSVYDENGLLILKAGYDSSCALVFIDGSVYDERGAKIFSLNSDLSVTAYRYDEFGRLSAVSYPYSAARKAYMQEMLSEAGVQAIEHAEDLRSLSLSSEHYERLQKLCSQIGFGSYQVSVHETVLTEEFNYDENNNIVCRKNPYNTVYYSYDNENRLVSWGNGCLAEYDENGNMTRKKTPHAEISYSYSSSDRIQSCQIADFRSGARFEQKNEYDALGRRSKVWKTNEGGMKHTYIGQSLLTFASVRTSEGETMLSSKRAKTRNSTTDSSYSGRYVFIPDSRTESERYSAQTLSETTMEVCPLYDSDGALVSYFSGGTALGSESRVLLSDSVGSIRAEIGSDRLLNAYEYDAFGAPLAQSGKFGFIGKTFDEQTGLYDFGFRDYEPKNARFSSVDPAHDGVNWYSYCQGNPISFCDRNGLYAVATKEQYMQDMGHTLLGNSSDEYTDKEGCVVTAIAEALTALSGVPVTNDYINANKDCFNKEGLKGDISWSGVKAEFGLEKTTMYSSNSNVIALKASYDKYTETVKAVENSSFKVFSAGKIDAAREEAKSALNHVSSISNTLTEIANSRSPAVVLAQVAYGKSSAGNAYLHFVTIGTTIETVKGQQVVAITPTSRQDMAANVPHNSYRSPIGWIVENGKTYVPVAYINRIDVVSKAQ